MRKRKKKKDAEYQSIAGEKWGVDQSIGVRTRPITAQQCRKAQEGSGVIKPQLSRIELTASEKETRMRCQKGVEMEEI